jgi:hypothetical protein
MSPPNRQPGPTRSATAGFQLSTTFGLGGRKHGLAPHYSLGAEPLTLKLDPQLCKWMLRNSIGAREELRPLCDLVLEHGRPVLHLPFDEPNGTRLLPTLRMRDEEPGRRIVFELPEVSPAMARDSKSLVRFASQLGTTPDQLYGRRLWLVYRNDGSLPFNPGSGSDQGPTAFLGLYVTFDQKKTGLTRLGWTVIDMRTPRGNLAPGQEDGSNSIYGAAKGPYSGISSIDFTVTAARTGELKVDFKGAAGIDSAKWGKFVQDFIHKKVSNSPLFPWPENDPPKFFSEMGVAVLVTPQKALTSGEALGITYEGKIEFGGDVTLGTQGPRSGLDARFVIRTATVNSPLGKISAEYSPMGVFGRAFLRFNDGREGSLAGVEGGFRASALVQVGRLGIGLTGEITVSTDPALQTPNPAGSAPLLNPLAAPLGSDLQLGGPAGPHGVGQLVLTWSF